MGEAENSGTNTLKDSCSYALDLTKQFLTYSAAGIAFIVGIVYSDTPGKLPALAVAVSLLLLGVSIVFGCLCFMRIIGKLNTQRSYDVYDKAIQSFAIGQIVSFGFGIIFLGYTTLQTACHSSATTSARSAMTSKPSATPSKQVVPAAPTSAASPSSTR